MNKLNEKEIFQVVGGKCKCNCKEVGNILSAIYQAKQAAIDIFSAMARSNAVEAPKILYIGDADTLQECGYACHRGGMQFYNCI